MVSKKLMAVWAFFDFGLLAAGILALVLSFLWRSLNPLVNMVLTPNYLTAGMALGIAFLITFTISIAAIIQKNHVTIGLVVLNYVLLIDAICIVAIGSFIWVFTLKERNNFHLRWLKATPDTRIALQDKLKCCGYFNATDLVEIGGSFCQNLDVVQALETSDFCVTPITNFADTTLNHVFTTIYGFMAIVSCLLLTTLCVIKKREEEERFKRIDEKRGRAFV